MSAEPDTPASGDVRLSELVRVYDGALPTSLCRHIIDLFEGDPERQFRRAQQNTWVEYTVTQSPLPEWREIERTLIHCMADHIKDYSRMPAARMLGLRGPRSFEQLMIKKYEAGRETPDGFPEHFDAYNVSTSIRMLGFLWYLNDVENGGETDFAALGKRIPPRAGRLVVLPPMWMFAHSGLTPVSNPKYIVTSYLTFRDPDHELRFAYPLR